MRSCSSTTRRAERGGGRGLLAVLAAFAVLAAAAPVSAGERWYGAAAGAGATLAPLDRAGGWVAASAAMGGSVAEGPLHVAPRGTFVGFFARDCWAALPLLGGDAAALVGPARFFLTAGVQLFGFARRDDWTFFLPFGLHGGAGVSFDVGQHLRLGARALVTWLPAQISARIEEPETGEPPTLLLLGGGITAEWRNEVPEM